ncbi:S41 family peptidase [Luteimonas sp. 50]|uniref:S41 family peptidase n=1 Tax=Cognatiluteimonas sedimenti TaxID=2927791 RepID=A0ABT0A0K2_9GAMM|nr:S41 family peptidase [Lysobacter sedimenti]MCJ0824497.1 S41 family peptidase [Lysobacter sedimenti]
MSLLCAGMAMAAEPVRQTQMDEVVDRIVSDHVQAYSREELERRALRALVADIDPYGKVLDPAEWAEMRSGLDAGLAGVGVTLAIDEASSRPRVERLMIGSAAGGAGVRAGDWLDAIDGHDTHGQSYDAFIPRLLGAPGSVVRLTVRTGDDAPRTIAVTRKLHPLPSVHGVHRAEDGTAAYLLDAQRGIGYVRVARLASDSVGEVEAALATLRREHACGLVLDLRGSVGGYMSAGIGIADLFLSEGLIAGSEGRKGRELHHADADVAWAGPMVVLIDAETASSAEFLAAALRDHGRAPFVGQRTFGKGMVQEMFPLAAGGGLILSTARHVRPSGVAADRHDPPPANDNAGVSPDPGEEIALEGEDLARWREAMDLRASPTPVSAADLANAPADRALQRATGLLPSTCPR